MSDEIQSRVQRTLAQVLDVPSSEIGPSTEQETVSNWDSLHHIHLVTALESEFGVEIDPDDVLLLTSVPAIVACMVRLGAR